MRVGARFLYALWPEIGKTAVYLYNRTPNYGDSDTRWESSYTRFRRAVSLAREALAQYIRDKELPSAELIWEEKCESTSSIEQMLQKADDQEDNDYQEAKYTTAKFELITPSESFSAALLLYII
jgi:hypothetical protein